MRHSALLCAALAALWTTPASADMVITTDSGGSINQYAQRYAAARDSGKRVVIDGLCLSACTIALGIMPRGRVCATNNALLGFHAAWKPNAAGGRTNSAAHTQRLSEYYPAGVRHWIARNGGLSSEMIFLHGRELRAFVPPCKPGQTSTAVATPAMPAAQPVSGINSTPSRTRSETAAVELEITQLARRLGL